MPSIAILIATYRRPKGLRRLLESLVVQEISLPYYHYRIVVVDNDPLESAKQLVQTLSLNSPITIDYYPEATPGIPAARNSGIEASRKDDAVIFVDDDEVAPPNWLNTLLACWHNSDIDIITGPVQSLLPDDAPNWASKSEIFDKNPKKFSDGEIVPIAYTNNTLVSRLAIDTLSPGFDQAFQYSGSSDLHYFRRARLAGFKILWCQEALIYEVISAERLTVKWQCLRGLRTGMGFAKTEVMIRPKVAGVFYVVFQSLLRIGYGSCQLLVAILGGGWMHFFFGLRRVCSAIGSIAGLLGFQYLEYKRIDS